MNRNGIIGKKWLRYKVCWGLVKVGQGSGWWLVECEIEVLYEILARGVLEKMKKHPLSSNASKSKKSRLYSGCLWRSGRPALAGFAVLWLWAVCAAACLALAGFALACAVLCITQLLYYAHFVQLVKQLYFTSVATTIACTYSTYTNYSLQLQTIYAPYNVRARARFHICLYG